MLYYTFLYYNNYNKKYYHRLSIIVYLVHGIIIDYRLSKIYNIGMYHIFIAYIELYFYKSIV